MNSLPSTNLYETMYMHINIVVKIPAVTYMNLAEAQNCLALRHVLLVYLYPYSFICHNGYDTDFSGNLSGSLLYYQGGVATAHRVSNYPAADAVLGQ
jgi:hypothetical protein